MGVLFLEEKSLPSSSIILLTNESQQSKLKHEKILHCEFDIDEYICVLHNLMSNGFVKTNFKLKLPLDSLKTLMCSKKVEYIAP